MFRKSRRKIVAAIMSVLVLLWVGTLGIIYASSYLEMTKQNEQLLMSHVEKHKLPPAVKNEAPKEGPKKGEDNTADNVEPPKEGPKKDEDKATEGVEAPKSPKYELTTFYTVAFSYEGTVLQIQNKPHTGYSDEYLQNLAFSILVGKQVFGAEDNLSFLKVDKGSYMLVAFLDNTVMKDNAITLLRNTLIFGAFTMIAFFFLSVFLARIIVNPLENSYQKQKQFISDAGHELKTPVSIVSANAELLAREIGENQWLSNIQYENERMGLLVCQLLDLARTETVTMQMESVDFSHLVAGEALPFESVAFEKGLSLHCEIPPGICVEGNSNQLKQLTSILLDNAIRHSKTEGEVRLNLTKEHGVAELSVINNGEEIPAHQQAQIFERFYRMDTARNGEDKHYGLGLAIAKVIANSHRGNITLHCHNGLIEFRVKLPVLKKH